MKRWLWSCLIVLVGCGGGTTNPPVSRCDGVRCASSETCDPNTGRCVGGSVDAGHDAGFDAGRVDAGVDAGRIDAGVDAGFDAGIVDAGSPDAGLVDAGTTLDAGQPECTSNLECIGVRNRCDTSVGHCVECVVDQHCPSAIPQCDVVRGSCVECLSNADCSNPRPTCRAQQCDDCLALNECGIGRTCDLRIGDCSALPDSCAAPQPLAIPDAGGSTYLSYELDSAADDLTTSCGSGRDLVFALSLPAMRDVTVTARRVGQGTAVPAVALRSGTCSSGAEVACDLARDGGSAASLVLPGLAAGQHFIVLETPEGSTGRIELGVSAVPAQSSAPNDSCAAVESLQFFGTRAVTVGSTTLATNDGVGPSCNPYAASTGPELAYAYDADGGTNVRVSVRPIGGAQWQPVVSVRPSCVSAANELGCRVAAAVGSSTSLDLPNHPAGRFTVMVDSASVATGSFQLEVESTPIVGNDTCAAAQTLVFSGPSAAATGDTTYATHDGASTDATPSCSTSARTNGNDVAFTYTLTQARDVTVSVTPTGASPTYWPVVSVRSACADSTTPAELACVSPNSAVQARVSLLNQPAGMYAVWVDSAAQTSGPFQLEVVTAAPTPPPTNDTCATPLNLPLTSGSATVTGSTRQAANDNFAFDLSPTCSATARQNGRDVVYSFTLTAPRDVELEVTPAVGSTLRPVLYVRKTTCTSQLLGDELVCLERVGSAQTVLTALPAGTYFVFIDGAGGTSGDFTLRAVSRAATPAPANDECAGAAPLAFVADVATVTGTTFGASNSNVAIDNAPACGTDFIPRRFGRDLIYSYTLAAPRDVEVRVTTGGGSSYAPTVYVRGVGQCALGFAGNELACGASIGPGSALVYLPNQPAGTYPVFVDSNSYDTGLFTLQVRQLPATLPPSNDACAGATSVQRAMPVTGNTTGATDDYSLGSNPRYAPACGNRFMNGRDVVFAFTAPSTGTFTATLQPDGAFDPALLQLVQSCGAAQCSRAANTAGPGAAETITFSATSGATTFFVVDSVDGEAPYGFGTFTFRVD